LGSFFKKDVLVFWRDRKEVFMALFLPIFLIVVLNFAFSNLFNNDGESLNIDVAIVQEDNDNIGLEQFEETVNEMNLSQVEKETMLQQASVLEPAKMMLEFLNNPELKELVHSQELSEAEAIDLVENGEIDAIVKIPEGFTYEVLSSVMLGEEAAVALAIQADEQSTELDTLQMIMNNFINSLNMQFAIGNTAESNMAEPDFPQGGKEVVEGVETFTMSQYFTIAISLLCSLFLTQTVAIKTVTEKREGVFNRILLSNSNPLKFLMGKSIATFCLAWIQMIITFTVIQSFLDVFPSNSVEFGIGLIIVMTIFALAVSGLAALFTSITLNLDDTNAASGLSTLVIMIFAVLGGSFFPIQGLPNFMQIIGEWTPNGLTQTVLLEWIQFTDYQDLIIPITILVGFSIVCFVIAVSIFPRRGRM